MSFLAKMIFMREEPTSLLSAADQYHAGIVVDDPVATMAQLTDVLGYEWADEIGGSITVSVPDGYRQIEMRAWYSMTTPRLEVVQSHPGTVWTRADSRLHHVGYWADDATSKPGACDDDRGDRDRRGPGNGLRVRALAAVGGGPRHPA